MKTRIQHIFCDNNDDFLYAGDHRGIIYKLDKNLNIINISHKSINSGGFHVITGDKDRIYARDISGNLLIFNRETLNEERFIVTYYFYSKDRTNELPAPAPSNALKIYKNNILVNNVFGELVVLNKDNFTINKTLNFNGDSFNECINFEGNYHIISDCLGYVWKGNIDSGEFKRLLRIDHGNIHCVVYDATHDRYMATTDTYNGVCVFNANGDILDRLIMTRDDVEWLHFSVDYEYLFVACFDHYLYVYKNKEKLILDKKIGPFKFQLKQVIVDTLNRVYVLLESGEIYKVNFEISKIEKSIFGTNAAWYIDQIPNLENQFIAALESGQILHLKTTENNIHILHASKFFLFGRIRRALPIDAENYIAISSSGTVFRFNTKNEIAWQIETSAIARDISLHPDKHKCLVCNEAGMLLEIDVKTGEIINQKQFIKPLWTVLYFNPETILVGTRSNCINEETTNEVETISFLYKLNASDLSIEASIKADGNFKRMKKIDEKFALINGNGSILVATLDVEQFQFCKKYESWLLNTPEDAILNGEHLYVSTYGYQINTYERDTSTLIDSQFTTEDYPKTLALVNDKNRLLVGGRGFISLYDISNTVPSLIQTLMI